jgi:hypothetical protein
VNVGHVKDPVFDIADALVRLVGRAVQRSTLRP